MIARLKKYAWNWLLLCDHGANVVIGGDVHETISSRVWRNRDKRGMWVAIWFIDGIFGDGHCASSQEPDDHHRNEVVR